MTTYSIEKQLAEAAITMAAILYEAYQKMGEPEQTTYESRRLIQMMELVRSLQPKPELSVTYGTAQVMFPQETKNAIGSNQAQSA